MAILATRSYDDVQSDHLPLPTLNLKRIMSPSSTMYSLPFWRYLPSALTAFSDPRVTKSSYFMISAQMNPFSKSVWMTPAAWGALLYFRMVQHRTSSWPAVKQQISSRMEQPDLMILGIMVRLASSWVGSSMMVLSNSAEQGMISPGMFSSMKVLTFLSHLFFLEMQSSAERLTRQVTDLAVMKRCTFRASISAFFHSPFLTHLLASSLALTLLSSSSSATASLVLVLLMDLCTSSILPSQNSRSLRTNSLLMISMSLMGSMVSSVWVTSSSSKARMTWQMPSTSLMLLKKWLPNPSPLEAPLTRPAMSTIWRTAATSDLGFQSSQSLLNLSSGTGTTALLGSMVQKGQFSAGTLSLVIMLQVEDLPTLGSPTIPILRVFPGRPHRAGSSSTTTFLGGIYIQFNQILSPYPFYTLTPAGSASPAGMSGTPPGSSPGLAGTCTCSLSCPSPGVPLGSSTHFALWTSLHNPSSPYSCHRSYWNVAFFADLDFSQCR